MWLRSDAKSAPIKSKRKHEPQGLHPRHHHNHRRESLPITVFVVQCQSLCRLGALLWSQPYIPSWQWSRRYKSSDRRARFCKTCYRMCSFDIYMDTSSHPTYSHDSACQHATFLQGQTSLLPSYTQPTQRWPYWNLPLACTLRPIFRHRYHRLPIAFRGQRPPSTRN